MLDRIKKIPVQLYAIWNKYTKKQKTIIISIVGAVFLALILLVVLSNQITYTKLFKFEDNKEAIATIEVLEEAGIPYQASDDLLQIDVDESRKQEAQILLTTNDIISEEDFGTQELLENDLSTTKTDKELKLNLFTAAKLRKTIKTVEGVEDAQVQYFPSDTRNSIVADQRDTPCSVVLTVGKDFDATKSPKMIAATAAAGIGNRTTDDITVMDQYGNILFGGDEEDAENQVLDKNLAYRKELDKIYIDYMQGLAAMNDFTSAQIVPNFDINFDQSSQVYEEYIAAEGQEQGLQDTFHEIMSENTGNPGDIPGTDSNDENDYYVETQESGQSSYTETNIKYLPNKRVTETMKEFGEVVPETSSLAITMIRPVTRTEEELELAGLLEGTTFDEYVLNNSERTTLTLEPEFYELFAKASNVPVANIVITAYEQPNFIAKEESALDWNFYLQIILAALIVALLIFVIFRGMKQEDVTEVEPELSIEQLLATTKESQSLEDVEFGDKSETRVMIEKFVDENPEAVANLLRNWLNSDIWD